MSQHRGRLIINQMAISVLIATRNRPDDVVPCLKSVLAQEFSDFEIVVVDQSTTDATEQAIEKELGGQTRLRLIRSDTVGKSIALNLLMEAAKPESEIFAFTDDDTETPADWLANIERVFREEPKTAVIFGQVLPGVVPEDVQNAYVPSFCFSEKRYLRRGEISGMGANMAIRREVAERAGRFDPLLGPGAPMPASEEGDFIYRLHLCGARVLHDPSVTLVHRAWRSNDRWNSVLHSYGLGDAAFAMKHLRCRDWRMIWTMLHRYGYFFARLVYRILCRQKHQEEHYLAGYRIGIKMSRQYKVDIAKRLYIPASD